jgi:hypothetical protein
MSCSQVTRSFRAKHEERGPGDGMHNTYVSHRKASRMLAMLVCGYAIAVAAQAANLNYLKNSPVAYFQQDDTDMMMKNANAVLDSSDANAKKEWSNPRTGASGWAQVVGQFATSDGTPCKRLRLGNKAAQVEGESTYTVCKYPGRGWILNPDAKPAN